MDNKNIQSKLLKKAHRSLWKDINSQASRYKPTSNEYDLGRNILCGQIIPLLLLEQLVLVAETDQIPD